MGYFSFNLIKRVLLIVLDPCCKVNMSTPSSVSLWLPSAAPKAREPFPFRGLLRFKDTRDLLPARTDHELTHALTPRELKYRHAIPIGAVAVGAYGLFRHSSNKTLTAPLPGTYGLFRHSLNTPLTAPLPGTLAATTNIHSSHRHSILEKMEKMECLWLECMFVVAGVYVRRLWKSTVLSLAGR